MIAGPAALAVAFVLLPGWVYWRLEASPRTARSALGELFEVVAAGALASGAAVLAYVSLSDRLPDRVRGWRVGEFLIDPTDLTAAYVRDHLTKVCWTVAVIVGVACGMAALAAKTQRARRKCRLKDQSMYAPEVPIWVSALGATDRSLTVDLRDGRRLTGYFGGHSVDDDGAPTLLLTPPLSVATPRQRPLFSRAEPEPAVADYGGHAVVVPGAEITCVWRKWGDDD